MQGFLDPSFLIVQIVSGLTLAMFLFLISSGLTLIFGVLGIVNFAHGSFYMFGAYFAYAISSYLGAQYGFWASLIAAPLLVGVFGAIIEILFLRRIYAQEEFYQLLLTYGIVLLTDDAAKLIWGAEYKAIAKPELLSGSISILNGVIPTYNIFVLILAPLVAVCLWLILNKTRLGKIIRATSSDREMADALGINMKTLFTLVFAVGSLLGGLGGALAGPARTIFPGAGVEIIIESFVVVVIGGLGNLWGALLSSILIGLLESIGIIIFPEFQMVFIYILMIVVLIVKPWGLLGKPLKIKAVSEKGLGVEAQEISPVLFSFKPAVWLGFLFFLLALPFFFERYGIYLSSQIMVMALMALSFNLLLGYTGMLSFGQAAFFGVGAYATALLLTKASLPLIPALFVAPFVSAAAAGIIGFFCVRLTGIHFAMLTLAFGQLVYAIAFKWYSFTGGDNGIQGISIPEINLGFTTIDLNSAGTLYYICLAIVGICFYIIRLLRRSPFGATLKAIRENPQRADFIGVNVKTYQLAVFIIAGFFTGLAGGLFAVIEKAISPEIILWTKSAEPVLMTLVGGVYTFFGPALGSAVMIALNNFVTSKTEYWGLVIGSVLITLVTLLPGGIVGFLNEKFKEKLIKFKVIEKWEFLKSRI